MVIGIAYKPYILWDETQVWKVIWLLSQRRSTLRFVTSDGSTYGVRVMVPN